MHFKTSDDGFESIVLLNVNSNVLLQFMTFIKIYWLQNEQINKEYTFQLVVDLVSEAQMKNLNIIWILQSTQGFHSELRDSRSSSGGANVVLNSVGATVE